MTERSCPALLFAAPASGSGKTSLVAALARLHTRQGRRVKVFKCGPDFLDPQIHAMASGQPCDNFDLWICGEDDIRARLAQAAQDNDLILVEGVMGLFDGTPSSADIAERFGLPVLAVIDARAMAQTFGAVAFGLARFRPAVPFHGVLANRVGSAHHAGLLRAALPDGIHWCGALPRQDAASLPSRHLGLLPAAEIDDLTARIDLLADTLTDTPLAELPPPVSFAVPDQMPLPALLQGRRIAIARDAAYCFIYPANLELLTALGAELTFFSPLAGDALPDCDAAWLPGGYPELHAPALAARTDLAAQLRAHVNAGKPLLAECGGMMSVFERLVDLDGQSHAMFGLLAGHTVMGKRLAALGSQEVALPEGTLRGHAFHHSRCDSPLPPLAQAQKTDGRVGEPVWRAQRLTASYFHFYFPSNPAATAAMFLP
ncbi:cobyrinate a,c-diamide synthase [uncultured Propionivibrio sp.]|uniref:cobyrinate a,c-diamide synthase n=1 Tax=uncultured Propionivibrio sp. TaxID=426737 RepID=UPI0029C0B110|nr:cobyrinate a,c-diamide synthase [uncultured Propionivibrio sp.]